MDDREKRKGRLWAGVLCILSAACFSCCAQLLFKLGNTPLWLLGGLACYGLGAAFMLVSFRFGELSVLHPMLGAGYALSLLLGRAVLHEPLTPKRLLGVGVIMLGVFLVGRARRGEGDRER